MGKRGPKKGTVTKPKFDLDWEQLDKLCQFPHRHEDIAFILGCSVDTLESRIREKYDETISEYHEKRKSRIRISVLQKQYEVAMRGNVTMLIWLGKNMLGQADHKEPPKEKEVRETQAEQISKLKQMINDLPEK